MRLRGNPQMLWETRRVAEMMKFTLHVELKVRRLVRPLLTEMQVYLVTGC